MFSGCSSVCACVKAESFHAGLPSTSSFQIVLNRQHRCCCRYDTRCYFNVRSKAEMSQLNLPHAMVGHPSIRRAFQFFLSSELLTFYCSVVHARTVRLM